MRSRALSGLSLVIACDLCLLGTASFAQQAPATSQPSSPPRLGYYTRVRSQAGAASLRPRRSERRSAPSLRQRHSERRRHGRAPYERAPVVSPPERQTPAPAVSHNYFPGNRTGQASNRNVVPHCVPGRHSMMHR